MVSIEIGKHAFVISQTLKAKFPTLPTLHVVNMIRNNHMPYLAFSPSKLILICTSPRQILKKYLANQYMT